MENQRRKIKSVTAAAAALLLAAAFSLPAGTEIMGVRLGNAVVASADTITSADGNYVYVVNSDNDDTVTITGYNGSGGAVEIPSGIDGKTVTAIGNSAFYGCTSLESITIPDSITSIGYSAFYSCTSLTSITIPDGVTSIGNEAFRNCKNLGSVTFGENSQLSSIGQYVFQFCNITSITIPNSVTSIKRAAFMGCRNLTDIIFPSNSGFTSIEAQVFQNCTSLESITIPGSVTSIGWYAFYNCSSLTSVFIPENLDVSSASIPAAATQIKYTVNGNNVTVTEVTLGNDQSSFTIPDKISGNNDVTAVFIEDGKNVTASAAATKIRYTVNGNNVTVTEVTLGDGQSSFTIPDKIGGNDVTAVCIKEGTTGVDVPAAATKVKYTVSDENVMITEVTLGDGQSSFTIPETIGGENVTSIGDSAFNNCTNLKSIFIPNSITSIRTDAIPDTATQVKYTVSDGKVTISGSTKGTEQISLAIPKTIDGKAVTSIREGAFKGCTSLESITIPKSVTSIGDCVFFECSNLTSINIPDGVTSIGINAFNKCSSLTSITIPDSAKSIGECAFSDCTSLTSVTISDGVVAISMRAFSDCTSLTSVIIPDSVESIYDYAFLGCTSLESIFLPERLNVLYGVIPDTTTQIKYTVESERTVINEVTLGNDQTDCSLPATLFEKPVYPDSYCLKYCPQVTHTHRELSAPTCTDKAVCEVCGQEYGESLGHSFTKYVSDNNATCTENGTETAECDNGCGKTDTREEADSALGHSFTNYISNDNATCTENGTETAKCDRCDITDTREEADSALGHSFTNYVSNNDATCTENGTETADCDRCDITDTREEADSALGHSFTNYISNDNATCTENGTETAECDNGCGKTDTREKANSALEHSFTKYVSDNNATCTKNGTETAKCDRCDETDTKDIANSALGHSFTNYVSDNNATCTENGTETAKCDRCDKTDTREIADTALGHDHSGDWQKNDTEHWKVCARKDCTEILDKASHDYDNGVITTQPTEEKEGVKTYTCETCGHTKTEPVAKLEATIALPKATATPGENSVTLKWNAVDGAKSYRIFYRVNGTTAWKTKNTTGTSVTITGLTGGTKYDFLVLAYDGTNWSKYTNSDIINATPKTAVVTPAKPVFTATPGVNSISLKWNAVSGAASYRVYYRVNGTTAWKYRNTTATAVTLTELTGGTKYDIAVRAYSGSAWSAFITRDIVNATPLVAGKKPVFSSVTPGVNRAILRWNAVDGAKSYRVFYRVSGTTKWSYKNTTLTAMNLTGLEGGKTYEFVVRAYDGSTWTAYSSADIVKAAIKS